MPPISVMIKPASAGCNLRCRYCFYENEAQARTVADRGHMRLDTLETVIKTFLSEAAGSCSFAFQGGEPTLAGLPFFEAAVACQKKHNTRGVAVYNALQTNGLLLNDAWCAFLKRNGFLVGLSLDGVKDTHDLYRVDAAGTGSYNRVQRAAQLLQKHGVPFHILTVVTAQLARCAGKVYGFYKRNNWLYQQYIPCMDPLENPRGQEVYSLSPQAYGDFLKRLFDLWYADFARGFVVSVRYFDNLIAILQGGLPENCAMAGRCSVQYVVEADGSVYPCDFYALDAFYLGNIADGTAALDQTRAELGFIAASLTQPQKCSKCPWRSLCRSGCRRDKLKNAQGALGENYYCESYRAFFAHAYPRLAQAAAVLARYNGGWG